MGVTGQKGSSSRLVLHAFDDERPAVTLARLSRSPHVVRLLSQLFVVASRRCFAGHDIREITRYVHDLLGWLDRPARGAPARQIEALIRAALGEPALAAGIAPARRNEIICTVIGDLARPPGGSPAVLGALIEQAEQRVDRFYRPSPRSSRRNRR